MADTATAAPPALAAALGEIRQDIDRAFGGLLPVPEDPRARLVETMRYAAIGGGKRLRPLLLVTVAQMFGADRESAILAGCAIEAIHIYSLVHDDLPCMDDDAMRHGKPTAHIAFDEASAVLAGDALLALAFEILTMPEVSSDPFVQSELVSILARASGVNGMAGGQMMDIAASEASFDVHAITRLQQLKTGALLGASVEMGAALAKLPPEGRGPLLNYARDIGLAFQIADDLLDAEGDEALAGKALRKDDGQGKQTFLTLMGAEGARAQADALADQAIAHLAHYGEEANLLRDLARYIVERDR